MQKEHERKEPKKNKDHTSSSIHSPDITYEREERGTYQSGYNTNSSEQYATKTIPKLKPPVEQRPTKTQDAIKVSKVLVDVTIQWCLVKCELSFIFSKQGGLPLCKGEFSILKLDCSTQFWREYPLFWSLSLFASHRQVKRTVGFKLRVQPL